MNILFVSNRSAFFTNPFGGAEASMKRLAVELASRGHHIYYLTKKFEQPRILGVRRRFVQGIQLLSLDFAQSPTSSSQSQPTIYHRIFNEWQSTLFTKSLEQVIRKNKIDLVYCFYELNILDKLIDIRRKKVDFKIVMRMAGLLWAELCLKNTENIARYQAVFNEIDSVNFLSAESRKLIYEKIFELNMQVSFKQEFIADIGASISTKRKENYQPQKLDKWEMIMAARFSENAKRQDILVEAMAKVPAQLPIHLNLIGAGPKQDFIKNLIQNKQLESRISIIDFLPQEKLWRKMQCAQLLCHACDHEGVSKTILESMAIGLPILASNVAPLNDYLHEGLNGFLVENEPEAWANKIICLYNQPDRLKDVSHKEMQYARENFSSESNAKKYEAIFKEIIDH